MAAEPFNLDKFKEDYKKYGKYDLEKQIPHLSALAEEYFQRYLNGGEWTDCIKVHVISARKSKNVLLLCSTYKKEVCITPRQKSIQIQKSIDL